LGRSHTAWPRANVAALDGVAAAANAAASDANAAAAAAAATAATATDHFIRIANTITDTSTVTHYLFAGAKLISSKVIHITYAATKLLAGRTAFVGYMIVRIVQVLARLVWSQTAWPGSDVFALEDVLFETLESQKENGMKQRLVENEMHVRHDWCGDACFYKEQISCLPSRPTERTPPRGHSHRRSHRQVRQLLLN
jgi:hypothetical protein